jgi:hypothetical protein
MKRIICLTAAVMMLPIAQAWAQASSGADAIRVVLPRRVESRSCRLQYSLVGPFGEYGGFARPKPDASEFEIETVHGGEAVAGLRAILSCSGYQIETMEFNSLPSFDGRTIQVQLKPLGTVRFRGIVAGLTSGQLKGLYVDVDYTPWWICEFLHWADCGLGAWRVASVELDADGRFSATLPDLARDAVIRSFKHPGEFAFRIRDQKTGNSLFELTAAGTSSQIPGRVPVAGRYAGEQMFDAELPK